MIIMSLFYIVRIILKYVHSCHLPDAAAVPVQGCPPPCDGDWPGPPHPLPRPRRLRGWPPPQLPPLSSPLPPLSAPLALPLPLLSPPLPAPVLLQLPLWVPRPQRLHARGGAKVTPPSITILWVVRAAAGEAHATGADFSAATNVVAAVVAFLVLAVATATSAAVAAGPRLVDPVPAAPSPPRPPPLAVYGRCARRVGAQPRALRVADQEPRLVAAL